jgi:hypothetical protein
MIGRQNLLLAEGLWYLRNGILGNRHSLTGKLDDRVRLNAHNFLEE